MIKRKPMRQKGIRRAPRNPRLARRRSLGKKRVKVLSVSNMRKKNFQTKGSPLKSYKRNAPKRKKKSLVKSVSQLQKLADELCSRFVRLSGIDKEGYATCYTCGHRAHYKKLHAGHFVSRFVKITRYSLDNLRIQCPMCNLWKRGDILTFRENLIKEIGEDKVLWLEKQR